MDSALWPAFVGAVLGLPLLIWTSMWLVKRKSTLPRWQLWSLVALLALTEALYWINVYAWFVEPDRLEVRQVAIESEAWRGNPITVAMIGDTLVGSPHVSAARVAGIVERLNAQHPDLVVLLGDYAGGHLPEARRSQAARDEIRAGIEAFKQLQTPMGIVAVLGNHDSWYGRETIAHELEQAGARVLWNQTLRIARPSGDLEIVGLADLDTGHPDWRAALAGAPPLPTIVLSHSPDTFVDMPRGFVAMLAAHTHCGQVWLPIIGRPVVPSRYGQRYSCGLTEEDGRTLLVTGGIGTSILPVRFLTPPEVVLVRFSAPGSDLLPED